MAKSSAYKQYLARIAKTCTTTTAYNNIVNNKNVIEVVEEKKNINIENDVINLMDNDDVINISEVPEDFFEEE